jgi:hypothetical protein
MSAPFTCPRCLWTGPTRPDTRFCPHCGLPDPQAAGAGPIEITTRHRTLRVLDRIAIGSISSVYRCRFVDAGHDVEGVFKIARDARTNHLLGNEADILQQLLGRDEHGRFRPFLPQVVETIHVGGTSATAARRANVLRMHPAIRSPDELYTLAEVREAYPNGLDGRDVAWMWRRILSVLGFIHTHGVVHGAVLPMHVMIEPREHKLVLIDWCCAMREPKPHGPPLTIISGGYRSWYKREGAYRAAPTSALDMAFAARCIIELLGGDPLNATAPDGVEPALMRHLGRCLGGGGEPRLLEAWKVLDDFDRLIEALWGPRRFRTLALPPRRK